MDKVARTGIRMCDLIDPEVFAEKLKIQVDYKNAIIAKFMAVSHSIMMRC